MAELQFGAVYFRKSAPPAADWARDYAVAAEDGHTCFRHWFCWNAIEIAPGVFDWADYDAQLDLAARNGISVVIAEMAIDYPEWLYAARPEGRGEMADGTRRRSEMHGSSATGGHYGLCLDDPVVAERAGAFLGALAARYKDHPALYGYDIWNECTLYSPDRLCYCPSTQEKFRAWLRRKYGDLRSLARTWLRLSLTDWAQVELPRRFGFFPEVYDAIRFWNDNAFDQMRLRYRTIRAVDPIHPIGAHGNARSFNDIAAACGDDFRAAAIADFFGYTYYYGTGCDHLLAADLIRSASNEKEFWRAEAIGGAAWNDRSPFDTPKPLKDAMADPARIRLDCLESLAAGARGYFNPRWRPLTTGPLFAAYGWYGIDGRRTPRSAVAAELAHWVADPALRRLWRSRPVRGECAILIVEEAQTTSLMLSGEQHSYAHAYSLCVQGIWEALREAGVQCDFCKIDGIDAYELLFLPYPMALSDEKISALRTWVAAGGTLVSEACFGYFDEYGRARTDDGARGFGDLFSCAESEPSFAADSLNDLRFFAGEHGVAGGIARTSFVVPIPDGEVVGRYADGSIAFVDSRVGRGRTRIAGTMFGYGFKRTNGEGEVAAATRDWIASALSFAGKRPRVLVRTSGVVARLWDGEGGRFLWLVNRTGEAASVEAYIDTDSEPLDSILVLRGTATVEGGAVRATVPALDAAIIALGSS